MKQLKNMVLLSNWNTSLINDMSKFNGREDFNEDISKWNVSNVTNMKNMFDGCKKFNQPLNNWDVSNVTNMENYVFLCSQSFNQPLNNWNVSNVKYVLYVSSLYTF